MSHG
ncbi:hypothetical protein E2C01_077947 [Portunus trituberculatus]